MAFLDELKKIEATNKSKEEAIAILQKLTEQHERTLLKRHLKKIHDEIKDQIVQVVNEGEFEGEAERKEMSGTYRLQSFVYMSFDFEPPYPEGITEEMVQGALAYKDDAKIKPRVRIEPEFVLERTRTSILGRKKKHEGIVRLSADSRWFFEELDAMLREDGIELRSITAPITKINRIITLPSYKSELKCSYTVESGSDHRLNYEDASYITIRYRLIF